MSIVDKSTRLDNPSTFPPLADQQALSRWLDAHALPPGWWAECADGPVVVALAERRCPVCWCQRDRSRCRLLPAGGVGCRVWGAGARRVSNDPPGWRWVGDVDTFSVYRPAARRACR
jgi:hypothetical protein